MANKITAFLHLYFILTEVYWREYLCYWCLFIEIWTNMNIRFGFHFNCSHISNPFNILLQLYCVLCGTFLPYSLMKFINFQFSLLLYLSLSSSPSLRFVSISFSLAARYSFQIECELCTNIIDRLWYCYYHYYRTICMDSRVMSWKWKQFRFKL